MADIITADFNAFTGFVGGVVGVSATPFVAGEAVGAIVVVIAPIITRALWDVELLAADIPWYLGSFGLALGRRGCYRNGGQLS